MVTTIFLASITTFVIITQCYQLEQKDKFVSLSTGVLAAKGRLKKRCAHCSVRQRTDESTWSPPARSAASPLGCLPLVVGPGVRSAAEEEEY